VRSPILAASARPILWTSIALSAWILLRGRDEPGGGFIGGLVAACGLRVLALSAGPEAARRALRVHPVVLAGAGLCAALASGALAMLGRAPILTHLWGSLDLGPVDIPLGTTLAFDVGVYLVVVGMAMAVTLPFIEEE